MPVRKPTSHKQPTAAQTAKALLTFKVADNAYNMTFRQYTSALQESNKIVDRFKKVEHQAALQALYRHLLASMKAKLDRAEKCLGRLIHNRR